MSRPSKSPEVSSRRLVTVKRVPTKESFRWPKRLAALLGKVPDGELALQAGISKDTVATERKRRGIEAFHPVGEPVVWTRERIEMLGTDSDAAVARELGLHYASVKYKRQLLGIPPFHPKRRPSAAGYPWTPEEVALLGTMSDGAVAMELGITKGMVTWKRTRAGIPPFRAKRRVYQWTEAKLSLLGKMPDREVARISGFSVSSVQRKRTALGLAPGGKVGAVVPTPELVELLHQKSVEVNRQTGLSPTTIRVLRQKLGIQRFRRWTPELVARLGHEPDARIARELGISVTSVHKKRWRHGIPPFQAKRRWRPEELEIVGTAPDEEIARKLGRTPEAVAHARRMRERGQR